MSWQSYVDDQLLATKVVTKAVIAGHDGSVWAASEGFKAGGRGNLPAYMYFVHDTRRGEDAVITR
jgi:hypothetical protein